MTTATLSAPGRRTPLTRLLGVMLAMVAAATIVLAGGTTTASASALPGPVRDLKVSFHKKYATFSWDAASGATRYVVVIEPGGAMGPFPATASTTSTSVRISYKDFPRYNTQKTGWEFIVEGYNKAGAGKVATSKAGVKLTAKGTKVKASSAKWSPRRQLMLEGR